MDIISLVINGAVVVVAFFNLLLGSLVLMRNPRNNMNRIFFCIAISFFAWCMSLFFYEYPIFLNSVFWIKMTYMMVVSFVGFILLFTFFFPFVKLGKALYVALAGVLAYALFSIYLLYFTNTFVVDVVKVPHNEVILDIQVYLIWTTLTWLVLIGSVANLLTKRKEASMTERVQMNYFWIAFIVYGIAVCIPDVFIPLLWGTTRYFFISAVCNIFFSGTVAYIILKHRFLDIRFVVARIVAYTLLIVFLGSMYGLIITYIGSYFLRQTLGFNYLIFSTVLTLFAAITFQPIRFFFEATTDKFLYRENYQVDNLLQEVSHGIVTALSMHELTDNMCRILEDKMHISKTLFIIKKKEAGNTVYGHEKYVNSLTLTDQEVQVLDTQHKMVVFEELHDASPVKEIMRKHEISIFMPLHAADRYVGSVLLGLKASGEIYFEKDLRVLDIVSSELAVAIENAHSFEEIQHFNATLTQEVDRATSELREANRRLQELDTLKDEFVSVTSHELRTPMTVIQGYVWRVLNDSTVTLTDKTKDRLERAYNSTRRLIALVNDILDVSRIEAGRMQFDLQIVPLHDLVAEVVEELSAKSSEVATKVVADVPANTMVLADKDKLHQVLFNLLDNAIKFTSKGTITISAKQDATAVIISVADTGTGIKQEDMSKLFTKFGKLDSSLSLDTKHVGTGLGLYLSKKIVENMHGTIEASSIVGQGTTFTMRFPLSIQQTAPPLTATA
jgi:signal transduction histidine kinase